MAYIDVVRTDSLNPAGQTIQYRRFDSYSSYRMTGSGTLSGTITVQDNPNDPLGNPYSPVNVQGMSYRIRYEAQMLYAASNVITIFGRTLTAVEALNTLDITATYLGSSWDVTVIYVKKQTINILTLTSGGGTANINFGSVTEYLIDGSGTLSSSWTIQADPSLSPLAYYAPISLKFTYNGNFLLNGNQITIFGQKLTQQQASGNVIIYTTFDYYSATWITTVLEHDNTVRFNQGVETTTYAGAQTVQLDPNVNKNLQVILGSGTMSGNFAMSLTSVIGAGNIRNGEGFVVFYNGGMVANGYTVNIFGAVLTDAEVQTGGITISAMWNGSSLVVQKSANPQNIFGQKDLLIMYVSFDSYYELGDLAVTIPYDFKTVSINACVSKIMAGVDNGTIVVDKNGTPFSTITIPASSGVGTQVNTNVAQAGVAGDTLNFTTTKPTTGGRVQLAITLLRTP